jgi:NAD(P)-dependent dehydrogenase (short-subunit alcohol dehydrogenase family)
MQKSSNEEMFSLKGKHILITGSSGEIGRETAIVLSRLGAKLSITGRDEDKLQDTARICEGDISIFPFDLSEINKIPEWMRTITSKQGEFFGIVHCAGISAIVPIKIMKWERAEEIMRLNWGTSWMLAKSFRQRGNFQQDGSRIIFIASTAGIIGESAMSAYSSSKGAIISLTRALASEFAPEKINVNAIAPGFIETSMNERYLASISEEQKTAMKKRHLLGFGAVRDVAGAVAYLLSDAGRWITGAVIPVDGGLTAV